MSRATPQTVAAHLDRELAELNAAGILNEEQMTAALLEAALLLDAASFRFAKTMLENPHHYTHIDTWEDKEAFYRVVTTIRRFGIRTTFRGWPYVELHVGDVFYWTMGYPIRETTLINRKP